MVKKQIDIEMEGEVTEALPNTMFRIKLEDGRIVTCSLAGKMRIHHIRVMPGDRVRIVMTPYDEKRGRIIYRNK